MIKATLKLCTQATIIHLAAYWNSTFLSAYTPASSTTPRWLSSITENSHVTYWFSKCQMVWKLTMLMHNKQKGKSSIYLCPAKTSIEWGKACNHMPVTKNHVVMWSTWDSTQKECRIQNATIMSRCTISFQALWSIIADDKKCKEWIPIKLSYKIHQKKVHQLQKLHFPKFYF